MIISRTPFRVSFFGGGTDYPKWFEKNRGAVLGTTINKYCYISCRYLPPFFEHRSRIIYSKMEHVQKTNDIEHPSVREVLKFLKVKEGVEIHHDGDLPARTGLGSSSSFTVGMLNTLYALKGQMPTKEQLAKEAIFIEQKKCKENVGCQDQVFASYGGFNFIEFSGHDQFYVQNVALANKKLERLQSYLMLYFTGFSRLASQIAGHQIKNIPKKKKELSAMQQMVPQGLELLKGKNLIKFGQLLDESWKLKKSLSNKITTSAIDNIYNTAKRAGMVGGKLLGAGGGGFILLFVPPERQSKVKEKLKKLLLVPFKFENLGSQVIFYQPNGDSHD